jgi:hypothetical protein
MKIHRGKMDIIKPLFRPVEQSAYDGILIIKLEK